MSGCTKPCRCYITRQAVRNLGHVTSRVGLYETLAILHHASGCTKPCRCYITCQAVRSLGDVTSLVRLYKTLSVLHHVSGCTKPWRCDITCQAVRNLGDVTSRVSLYETVAMWPKLQVQYRLTSTEAIRSIRDGEPRTASSPFTQLLSSVAEVSK